MRDTRHKDFEILRVSWIMPKNQAQSLWQRIKIAWGVLRGREFGEISLNTSQVQELHAEIGKIVESSGNLQLEEGV